MVVWDHAAVEVPLGSVHAAGEATLHEAVMAVVVHTWDNLGARLGLGAATWDRLHEAAEGA